MGYNEVKQVKAKIQRNQEILPRYYKMVLDAPEVAGEAKPGQFVHVRCGDEYRPLLRRPFSIHKIQNSKVKGKKAISDKRYAICDLIEILYKVVGEGTRVLSEKKKGEELDLIGPLGTGYRVQGLGDRVQNVILVGGGVGVASLLFLAEELKKRSTVNRERLTVLIGAKTRDQVLCEDDFKDLGCEVKISTEDGSYGYKGLVTDILKSKISAQGGSASGGKNQKSKVIYGCGPRLMLKEVAEIADKNNTPCQVSLEEHMACGLGACLGCAIKIANSQQPTVDSFIYKKVCKDGPVFNAREIFWG